MNWVVLTYSETYSEETKCIKVNNNPFSCNQESCQTKSIRKCLRINNIFQSFLFANIPAESPSYVPTFFVEILVNVSNIEFSMLLSRNKPSVTLKHPVVTSHKCSLQSQ